MVAGMVALSPLARGGSAVSREAIASQTAIASAVRATESSRVLFGEKAKAIAALREMAFECACEGWDGNAACGIGPMALAHAIDFLRALPESFPLPECAPEPDGSVSFEWAFARHRRFMVSIGERPRLAHAWVDGTDRGHAVARFDGFNIPDRILQGLASLLIHERTAVRTA